MKPRILYRLHIACAVGVVSGEDAVVVYDGIYSPYEPGCGGKAVAEGYHPVFIGHGQIKAAGIHGLQTVHGGGKGLFVYVKGQVAVVQVQGLKGRIVHHGGNTVGTGTAKEADEACMPGDGMFHRSLQIDFNEAIISAEGEDCNGG